MDKIKPIQLPVRYDEKASQLVDAEGSAWLDVDVLDYDDREICEAMVVQIADALNAAADKDRQITALQTLLTATDALLDFLNKESVVPPAQIAWQIADARVTATNILAESKRIQEGE